MLSIRLLPLLLVVHTCLWSAVKLPALISDHMLIQRDAPVRIWGRADPGETINVSFRGLNISTKADAGGAWQAFLPPSPEGGPHTLSILASNTVAIQDVLVGDVWVASGQSNMVWNVGRAANAQTEIAAAGNPRLRLFKVKQASAAAPQDDVEGEWMVCSPETVKDFSAVGYFFARALLASEGVPQGVIQSAWGGSRAEAWVERTVLEQDPSLQYTLDDWTRLQAKYREDERAYQAKLKEWERRTRKPGGASVPKPDAPRKPFDQWTPAGLYNAMIAPLTPYALRGVIWYQGENNAHRGDGLKYRHLFETLIRNWRLAWGQGDFPFLFVQLANYAKVPEGGAWPELREAQRQTLEIRNTGMAVIIDIGESEDIHPANKQDVGLRLALAARAVAYGQSVTHSGPLARQMTVEAEGVARVRFDHAAGGLKVKGRELAGFEIAGPDGRFMPAEARIDGETVLVTNPAVPVPAAVRYAWANDPPATLYNSAGLPASPFRVPAAGW